MNTNNGIGLNTGSDDGAGVSSADTGAGYGVYSTSSSGIGVLGIAGANTAISWPVAQEAGVYGGGTGTGVYGGYFTADTEDTVLGAYTSATGGSNGVKGTNGSSSTTSSGVFGYHSGAGYGVRGEGSTGAGVYGTSTSGDGLYGASTSGYGAYATSSGADALHAVYSGSGGSSAVAGVVSGLTGNGVYGSATASSSYYAGTFNGDVNVGYCLYVNGTKISGTCVTSDRRLKKNIEPLKGALDRLLQINGVTFEWIAPPQAKEGIKPETGVQTGVIAQDVEKVFPQWVSENQNGMKTVNIDQRTLLGVVVESFRTLKNENDDLKKQNQAMKSDVDELRSVVYSMNPNRAGFTFGNGGWGVAGLGIGLAFMAGRRRRDEKTT